MARLFLCISFLCMLLYTQGHDHAHGEHQTHDHDHHGQCQFGIDAAKRSAKATNELGMKIFEKISKPEENLIFSPVSIALALALVESGTATETRNEIQRHLAPAGSNQLDSSTLYESLQRQLQIKGGDKASLTIANGLFYSQDLTLKADYVNRTKQCFDTQVEKAPFKSDSEAGRRQVNQWVSEKTAQKIPELFKPRSITKDTVAVLANAVYLKAAWADRFQDSENLQFYKFGRANEAQSVSFMVRQDRYQYAENDKAQLVEIPYSGASSLSMFVILPKQRDGLQAVLKSDKAELKALFNSTTRRKVNVKLPKFNIRTTVDLKPVLQQLGINKIFTDQADFSRMAVNKVAISSAVHEAFIKVNENGTEAAAATGFSIVPMSLPPPETPVQFTADHPFTFLIMHKATKSPIFAGKVVKVEQD